MFRRFTDYLTQCDALNLATRNGHQDVTRLFYDHEVAVNNTITLEPPCLISKDETMENANKRVKVFPNLLAPITLSDTIPVGTHWTYTGIRLSRDSDSSIVPRR